MQLLQWQHAPPIVDDTDICTSTAAGEATASDTDLNLCCGSTLDQKSCAVVVPLICLDLVDVTSIDGVAGSQDVHDVLRLRCRTLQSNHNCRQHNAAAVIKWPPSMDLHSVHK